MVGQREFHGRPRRMGPWKSISEIARATGRDRKTIRRLLREGAAAPRTPRKSAPSSTPSANTCSPAWSERIR